MRYHPQLQRIRDRLEHDGQPNLSALPIDQARAADQEWSRIAARTAEPVAQVANLRIRGTGGEIPLRVFTPSGEGPWPVLVYFFGGGWCLGSLDTCDSVCRILTNTAGCLTVAAGYRLAPEHKFPAAVQDCYQAACWAASHGAGVGADPDRIAVGGDSSGGNLAAAVTLLARNSGPSFTHQLLVCPPTACQADTPSMRQMNDPHFFNAAAASRYWSLYLPAAGDGANPLASPLMAPEVCGLPPATVITAEYDPVRDEAEQYAARLRAAGVPVEVRRYPAMAHGFFTMTGVLDAAREAAGYAASRLRAAFGTGT